MKIEKNGVIINGTNVLTMEELGMDEPGGVIRIPLSRVADRYGLSVPGLLRGVDLDWLSAEHNDEDYRDVVMYVATHTYVAANGKALKFVLQYIINGADARQYMTTGDTDVSAVVSRGVIRISLANLIRRYGLDLSILLDDDAELQRLANWGSGSAKNCDIYTRQCIIKYYFPCHDARMYAFTHDLSKAYVEGIPYVDGVAVETGIDLS